MTTDTTVLNPATHEVIESHAETDSRGIHAIVEDVNRFQWGGWAGRGPARAEAMQAWAAAIAEHREELVDDLVAQTGKPVTEAHLEVSASIDALAFNAGMCRLPSGSAGPLPDGSITHTLREPVGVSAFIVPWNWPLLLLFRDLAPGMAAGVAAVVKPSPQTAAVTHRVLELGWAAGVPRDAVRVVFGGANTGAALLGERAVRAVAFTGSSRTGVSIMQAAARDMTRPLLELGGKGVALLMQDADVDKALDRLVPSAYVTSGQMCMACTRILAHRDVVDDVVAGFVSRARDLRVGDPTRADTRMGPLISHEHGSRVMEVLATMPSRAHVVHGGGQVSPDGLPGFFMEPTVVTGLMPSDVAVREEIFGPVVSIESFSTEAEAVRTANATPFGLVASVWTSHVERAWRLGRGISAGTVWVNNYNKSYPEMPSGGYNMSGLGRTRGIEGIQHFTEVKNVHFSP